MSPARAMARSTRANQRTTNARSTNPRTTNPPTTNGPTTNSPLVPPPRTNPRGENAPRTNRPSTNAGTTNARTTNAGTTNARTTNALRTNAPPTNARSTNAPRTYTPSTNARTTNAPRTNTPSTNARGTNARGTNARATNARGANARSTNARSANARSTNAPPTNARSTNAPPTNARGANAPPTNARGANAPRSSAVELSAAAARQLALAAQQLGARPERATLGHARAVFDAISLIQVDSVNVVCRSQELPLWARLGPHERDALPALCKQGAIFEYWAHEASLMPVELQPLLRWRMAEAHTSSWRVVRTIAERDPGYVAEVRAEVHARGQLIARDLEHRALPVKNPDSWWRWDDRKRALAYLFWAGEITAIRSTATFERVYAPLDRVLPAHVLATPTPDPDDARRELLVRSARALGVATVRDLADYFRIAVPIARRLIAELVEAGKLLPAAVEGWREPGYLHPEATAAQRISACTLLSPFDSLVWERRRTERLFGFEYRIEIYTPAGKRKYGYYVLPFLLGDALVARVDVKSDRDASALRVHAAYAERGAPVGTAAALAGELTAFARWLGLDRVVIGRRGDLSRALRDAL
jgi:uncharacterized protein YcaQ